MKAFKAFKGLLHKTFWNTEKKCENKYLSQFPLSIRGQDEKV